MWIDSPDPRIRPLGGHFIVWVKINKMSFGQIVCHHPVGKQGRPHARHAKIIECHRAGNHDATTNLDRLTVPILIRELPAIPEPVIGKT